MPVCRFPALVAIGAALFINGCLKITEPAGPIPTPPPTGTTPVATPTPMPSIPANKQRMYADMPADKWSRATIRGTVTDAEGKPIDGVAVTATITDSLGWQAVNLPPDTESDGNPYVIHQHVLAMGTLDQFASNSDSASTTTKADGTWSLEGAPVGGVYQLTVAKSGYRTETAARIVKQAAKATWEAPVDPTVNVINVRLVKNP